jgi:hypothetical protein
MNQILDDMEKDEKTKKAILDIFESFKNEIIWQKNP